MAKSISDAVRRQTEQTHTQGASHASVAVGKGVLGYKREYSEDAWEHIEAEREAMRERLLAEG